MRARYRRAVGRSGPAAAGAYRAVVLLARFAFAVVVAVDVVVGAVVVVVGAVVVVVGAVVVVG
jgi:hypothetical protein